MKIVDCVGREIKVGSSVMYAVRRFSDITFKRMTVQQIVVAGDAPYLSGFKPDGRRVQVRNLKTVMVIVPLGCFVADEPVENEAIT